MVMQVSEGVRCLSIGRTRSDSRSTSLRLHSHLRHLSKTTQTIQTLSWIKGSRRKFRFGWILHRVQKFLLAKFTTTIKHNLDKTGARIKGDLLRGCRASLGAEFDDVIYDCQSEWKRPIVDWISDLCRRNPLDSGSRLGWRVTSSHDTSQRSGVTPQVTPFTHSLNDNAPIIFVVFVFILLSN